MFFEFPIFRYCHPDVHWAQNTLGLFVKRKVSEVICLDLNRRQIWETGVSDPVWPNEANCAQPDRIRLSDVTERGSVALSSGIASLNGPRPAYWILDELYCFLFSCSFATQTIVFSFGEGQKVFMKKNWVFCVTVVFWRFAIWRSHKKSNMSALLGGHSGLRLWAPLFVGAAEARGPLMPFTPAGAWCVYIYIYSMSQLLPVSSGFNSDG